LKRKHPAAVPAPGPAPELPGDELAAIVRETSAELRAEVKALELPFDASLLIPFDDFAEIAAASAKMKWGTPAATRKRWVKHGRKPLAKSDEQTADD
jgi:hypothetical protein